MKALGAAVITLSLAIGAAAQSGTAQIPAGPSVAVSDGWYHLATCSIARGRQAPSMPLAEALRKSNTPCPICEPLEHEPEWAAFVTAHGAAIKEEVRIRREAEAAEAKRKADATEAERLKRLADMEAARKARETAPIPRLSETQVRDAAKAALAEAGGDALKFQSAFRTQIQTLSPDYTGPQVVHGSASLRVVVAGPVGKFEAAMVDRLLRKQPTTTVAWSPDVTVSVQPQNQESPDIKQVAVQRTDASRQGGAETMATALASTLVARPMVGAPAAYRINAGDVTFPLATFETGEGVSIRVIAVPATGAPLSRTFSSFALRAIQ
jgi:hypothetical protein